MLARPANTQTHRLHFALRSACSTCFIASCLCLIFSVPVCARTWTDTQGRKIRAIFIRLDKDGKAVLHFKAKEVAVPIERFSDKDRNYVDQQLDRRTRTWLNSNGRVSFEGQFLHFDGKVASIRDTDRKVVKMPVEKLSVVDGQFVRARRAIIGDAGRGPLPEIFLKWYSGVPYKIYVKHRGQPPEVTTYLGKCGDIAVFQDPKGRIYGSPLSALPKTGPLFVRSARQFVAMKPVDEYQATLATPSNHFGKNVSVVTVVGEIDGGRLLLCKAGGKQASVLPPSQFVSKSSDESRIENDPAENPVQIEAKLVRRVDGGGDRVSFSPDGRLLAAATGHTTKIWDISSGRELRRFVNRSRSVSFHPEKNILAMTQGRGIQCFDVESGKMDTRPEQFRSGMYCEFSDGGKILLYGRLHLYLLEVRHDKTRIRTPALDDGVSLLETAAISLKGDLVAVWTQRKGFKFDILIMGQDLKNPRALSDMPQGGISDLEFSRDGRYLAGACRRGRARIWDVTTGRAVRDYLGHSRNKHVRSVSLSPDGKWLATGGDDMTVRVYDIESGRELVKIEQNCSVKCVRFSPDGKRLAVCGSAIEKPYGATIWDLITKVASN